MNLVPIGLVGFGALILVCACGYALLRRPRALVVPDENDTVAFVFEGPLDGTAITVEGRVVLDWAVRGPSGATLALYELYDSDMTPARAPLRRAVPFFIDDGVNEPIRIDPSIALVTFDLPTVALESAVERQLPPGSRVQVVGKLRRMGAPGHEERWLEPADGAAAVALTFLAPASLTLAA